MLLSRIQTAEDAEGRIHWDVSVDPTAVRAHQHAAGARKERRGHSDVHPPE